MEEIVCVQAWSFETKVVLVEQHRPVGLKEVYVMKSGRSSLKGKLEQNCWKSQVKEFGIYFVDKLF